MHNKLNAMQNTFIPVYCHESDAYICFLFLPFLQADGESNC